MDNESVEPITRKEHNPDAGAKRTILRYQNPSDGQWYNWVPDLTAGVDYDYINVTPTTLVVDTLDFKTGGSGGSIVRTLTITYASSTADKVSNDLSNVSFS